MNEENINETNRPRGKKVFIILLLKIKNIKIDFLIQIKIVRVYHQ